MSSSSGGKLLSRSALLAWRDRMRSQGQRVVHCHGCFDIVHPGHIAHLQEARRLGDVLVVSVSSDAHVAKGPARPLIPDDLRAASLAALECVDAVFVNPFPTAVELLAELRPDVFVKGKEYERSADPRFHAERDAVTNAGGRVVFTSGDVVYSSTALIASLERTDPFEAEKLARLRDRYDLTTPKLAALVGGFRDLRVVVVGDYLRDRYHFCDATSVASEGPMMTLRLLASKDYDGGAAVLARHAATLGSTDVTLVTSLPPTSAPISGSASTPFSPAAGPHPAGSDADAVIARLAAAGIHTVGPRTRRDLVTKHRYLSDATKLLKVDEGSISPTDSADLDTLYHSFDRATAGGADVILFADFGCGLLTPAALDRLLPLARQRARILAADVSGRRGSLTRFADADLLTPTERELRDTLGDHTSSLPTVAWHLMHQTRAKSLIVTLGRQGAIAFDHPPLAAPDARLRSEHTPAFAPHALDPLGCGDALLTTAAMTLAAGGGAQAALLLGSLHAANHATKLGNDPQPPEDLLTRLQLLDHTPPTSTPLPIRLAS